MFKKKRKAISGVAIGLIAAVIFITIVLPLTISYMANTSKRFGAKTYEIEYQQYRMEEEKGILACYTQLSNETYVVKVNNTLGRTAVVKLIYVKYEGEDNHEAIISEEHKIGSVKYEIRLPPSTEKPKIVKLILASGAVINVSSCEELLIELPPKEETTPSYREVIKYIIKNRYPINVYWDEKQYPKGINPTPLTLFGWEFYLGYVLSHLYGNITAWELNDSVTAFLINGTLTPKDDWIKLSSYDIIRYLLSQSSGVNYAPAFIVDVGPSSDLHLGRNDAGDYLAMLFLVASDNFDNDTDVYGVNSPYKCNYFAYPPVGSFGVSGEPFRVKKLLLNMVYKYSDPDAAENDALGNLLINSGYDFLIVGIEISDDIKNMEFQTPGYDITYTGKIYLYPSSVLPTDVSENPENARVIVGFKIRFYEQQGGEHYPLIEYANITVKGAGEYDNIPVIYRKYFVKVGWFNYKYEPKLIDEFVFIVPEEFLGISGGENVSVTAELTVHIDDGDKSYDIHDIYGSANYEWATYVYMPVKDIVKSWVEELTG